jgi:hypothetical protein
MNAARVPLSTWILAFAALSFLAAKPACAGDPHRLDPDFLWFVAGHGVNVSAVADDGESPFATTKFVSVADVPPAIAARAKIDEIRAAVARLQTPGEHVLPAGRSPGGANADLTAAGLLSKLGGDLDAQQIDLVVGIDLKTGVERTLLHATRGGSLLDLATADTVTANFLPLYSIEPDRVRIHFKSDSQHRPAIDRTALAPFGSRKGEVFTLYEGLEVMPVAPLIRAIPTP